MILNKLPLHLLVHVLSKLFNFYYFLFLGIFLTFGLFLFGTVAGLLDCSVGVIKQKYI